MYRRTEIGTQIVDETTGSEIHRNLPLDGDSSLTGTGGFGGVTYEVAASNCYSAQYCRRRHREHRHIGCGIAYETAIFQCQFTASESEDCVGTAGESEIPDSQVTVRHRLLDEGLGRNPLYDVPHTVYHPVKA